MDKLKQMKKAYTRQKSNARQRNIKWQYNFEEWMLKWEESGKWSERGRKSQQYVMCRYNDEGPYSYYNTKIDTARNNNHEGIMNRFKNHVYKEKVRVKEGKGRPIDTGKPVIIDGVTYPTRNRAALTLGIPASTLKYRLKTGYYK